MYIFRTVKSTAEFTKVLLDPSNNMELSHAVMDPGQKFLTGVESAIFGLGLGNFP